MQAPQDVWDDDEGAWRTEGNGYLGEHVAIELQNTRWAGTVLLRIELLFCCALVLLRTCCCALVALLSSRLLSVAVFLGFVVASLALALVSLLSCSVLLCSWSSLLHSLALGGSHSGGVLLRSCSSPVVLLLSFGSLLLL